MRAFSFPVIGLLTALSLGFSVSGCSSPETPTAGELPAGQTDAADVTLVRFANESCPIMGGDPDPELTRQWNGKTIGFCCDGCPEKWDALSEEEKSEKLAEVAAGDSESHAHEHGDHEHGDPKHGDHEHGDQKADDDALQPSEPAHSAQQAAEPGN